MRWIRDRTGRFERRPYYAEHELDQQCQDIVEGFLKEKHGSPDYPITTDDLTVMIERDVAELDLYANLAGEGRGVEGVTELRRRRKPSVRIARYLSESPARENRLRSTLAHEYAHVVFHGFLWELEAGGGGRGPVRTQYRRCQRSRVVASPQTDWMEWQAGYASGALLMPVAPLVSMVRASLDEWGLRGRLPQGDPRRSELVERVSQAFAVSQAAANVRLSKLGYVAPA